MNRPLGVRVSRIFLTSVLISLCIAVLIVYQLRQTYIAVWANAEATNQNLLLTVKSLLQRTIDTIDTDLQHTAFYLSSRGSYPEEYEPSNILMFKPKVEGVVGYILVLNEHGSLLYAPNQQLYSETGFADRDYFKLQAANPHMGLYIGAPMVSRIDNELSVPLSRSWFKSDGSFGGIIIQTIKLDVLIELFSKLSMGQHNGINIFLRDGTALITFPYDESKNRQSFAGSSHFINFTQSDAGSFRSVSVTDSQHKFYSFRSLDGYPIVLSTVQTTKSILSGWRSNAAWQVSLALILMGVCLVMARRIEHVLRTQRVISERLRRTQRNMFQEKERFRVTLDSIREPVIATDANGCITYLNPAAQVLISLPLDQVQNIPIEQAIRFIKHDIDGGSLVNELPIIKALERGRFVSSVTEQIIMDQYGNAVHVEASAAPIFNRDHNLSGAVMVLHNVSRARSDAQQMEHLAQHDALTGLPNRRLLEVVGAQSIARAKRLNKMVGILFMDLDGFKDVNDSLGHASGDQLLLEFSKRLINKIRVADTLVRNGGDEFIVLAPDLDSLGEIKMLATRLIESCLEPFMVYGQAIHITISIGISVYPDNGNNLEDLVHMADQAMYQAKQRGRNQYCIYG